MDTIGDLVAEQERLEGILERLSTTPPGSPAAVFEAPVQLVPGRPVGPQPFDVALVVLGEHRAHGVDATRHHCREAMDGRLGAADLDELVLVEGGDACHVEMSEPASDGERPGEGPSHRHLLVEQHPDDERRRIVVEQPVGLVVTGDVEVADHAPNVPSVIVRISSLMADDTEYDVPVDPDADNNAHSAGDPARRARRNACSRSGAGRVTSRVIWLSVATA